ncbi:MAG: hypothetical protein ACK4F8_11125 [Aquabacterium sp.]
MSRFEHATTYFPLGYERNEKGFAIFKTDQPPINPMVEQFVQNDRYVRHMAEMGGDGWELVSVQAALRGVYHSEKGGTPAFSYPLTAGFFLFWKRQADHDQSRQS